MTSAAAAFVLSAAEEAAQANLVYDDTHLPPPPGKGGGPAAGDDDDDWMPPLTETGVRLFFCEKKYMLAHGERGGGKSIAALHKLVKHAYDNNGAAVCIATLVRSSATLGGAWTKLTSVVIPQWQDGWTDAEGNFHEGLGLEGEGKDGEIIYKMDDSRNRYFWIKTRDGGWSMFFLRSLMHGEHIQSRMKGMEFTAFFFDELTEAETEEYFIHPIQQLGRIPGVQPQFYIGACNPPEEGEDHWVFKRFFIGFDNPADKKPKKRTDYETFHFPMTENYFMAPAEKEEYLANVYEACRNDPTAEDRLLKGIWRKKPSGKGIFKDYFDRQIHVKGNAEKKMFIIPQGRIIDIGYDIGTANTAITFLQKVLTGRGEGWSIFDEIVLVERYVPIPNLAPILLKHMNYWCERTGIPFLFNHIGDSGSFDQMRPDGSYDARKLEECVHKELMDNHALYPGLHHLIEWEMVRDLVNGGLKKTGKPLAVFFKMVPCPKPAESVPTRVRIAISRLQSEELIVSAKCERVIAMFENLDYDEKKSLHHPKKSSPYKHALDSTTYPIYHHEMGGRLLAAPELGPTSNFVDLA